jgi:hypothetical protein
LWKRIVGEQGSAKDWYLGIHASASADLLNIAAWVSRFEAYYWKCFDSGIERRRISGVQPNDFQRDVAAIYSKRKRPTETYLSIDPWTLGELQLLLCDISSTLGCIGCSNHFVPFVLSVVGISGNYGKGEGRDNYGQPISANISKKWQSAVSATLPLSAFLFILVGLWLVKSTGAIVDVSVVNISKVIAGIGFFGWVTVHAGLDVLSFGHIYWGHLL